MPESAINKSLRPESVVIAAGRPARAPRAPVNPPIVLAAPLHYGPDDNYYSRQDSTDTVRALEEVLGALDGGTALAFASGMAAIAAVVEGRPSATIAVVPSSGYAGTTTLFADQAGLGRMEIRAVDITDNEQVLAALPGASLLWLETTTNPLLGVVDVPTLAAAAHAQGALVGVDATFSTPLLSRPLDQGADVVMHSATKYLSGHSDLLMGVLVTRDPALGAAVRARRDITGAVPGALEAFLALRGIRTLALRMERAQASALELARRLQDHPGVIRVRYPGLADDEWHERATQLYAGYGAMISFEVGSLQRADEVCRRVELINHATSLGGVESLIERRAMHPIDAANGIPADLVRFSVGIEHVEDLWADLAQALDQ
jgi:cystathionine gamma-synthase